MTSNSKLTKVMTKIEIKLVARRHLTVKLEDLFILFTAIYLRRHIYGERNSGIFGKNPHIFVPPKFWLPLQNPPNKFFCNLLEKG